MNKTLYLFLFLFIVVFETNAQITPSKRLPTSDGSFNNRTNSASENPFGKDSLKVNNRRILDDSTKLVYGATTSQYIYENDWLLMTGKNNLVDTAIVNLHRYNFVARNRNEYQDLGNLGTAIQAIYYQLPQKVGTRVGLNNLNPYILDDDNLRYYNTKSPHTSWYYAQGADGRSIIDVSMAQNVKPNWDVAFYYRGINSKILIGNELQNRNDRQATQQTFLFNTRYESKNHRYKLLAHISTYRHQINETGGLFTDNTEQKITVNPDNTTDTTFVSIPSSTYFGLEREELSNRLSGVESYRRREKFHVYQQYGLLGTDSSFQNLQIFHLLNRSTSLFDYDDTDYQGNSSFYKNILFSSEARSVGQSINYKRFDQKLGVKGKFGNIFYLGFIRTKNVNYFNYQKPVVSEEETISVRSQIRQNQLSVGFNASYQLKKTLELRALGEYTDSGVAKTEAHLKSKFIDAHYKNYFFEPSLLQQQYIGNFFRWDNRSFENTASNQFYVALKGNFGKLKLNPFAEFTTIKNHIYFDTLATPTQEKSVLKIFKAGLDAEFQMGKFHQKVHSIFAQQDEKSIIRMPKFFANYQIYLEKDILNKILFMQLGFDLHWQSAYFADAYMPVTQQFYLQDAYKVGDYLNLDVFLNYRLNNVTMFAKMNNILPSKTGGYYVTPDYMGQGRSFEFGLTWRLYD